MRVWIGVHLRQLSLDALCPYWRSEPVVVVASDRVRACSPAAIKAGVHPGMRPAGVSLICPEARVIEHSEPANEALLLDVALALLQYTPEVAKIDSDCLVMDVTASLRLFRGPLALHRRVRASLATLGVEAATSVAPTATGAWLLARRSGRRRRCLSLEQVRALLDPLPCSLLPAARKYLEWLEGIGCRDLATLRAMPRAGLKRRCSVALLAELDAAYGEAPELYEWITAPMTFNRQVELSDRVESTPALLFVAGRLLEQLAGWLAAHHRAVPRLVFALAHERGRHARAPTEIILAFGSPAWDPLHMLALLRETMANTPLEAPAVGMALNVTETQSREPLSESLFPEPGGSPADHEKLLELLVARLGRENVLHPKPVADYRPEVANCWVPVTEPVAAVGRIAAERPFWLLQNPIALLVRNHRPFYGTPLRLLRGPERIEDGWWSELAVRDYFVAEAHDGSRYWLYRERDDAQWYLHGLFA